jgi:protein gp37
MSETTKIEWCDSTFNPWIGCTKVSPACDDCYAARSTPARTLGVIWGAGEPRRRTSFGNWKQPEAWQRQAAEFRAKHGRRRRVFCASLADVFDNEVPDQWRADLFALIASTPDLDWLLVTKRIGNVARMLGDWQTAPLLPNIWLGITVVNQEEADRDVPKLLRVPAAVRFLSVEPMLGPVDLTNIPVGGGHGHHEFDPIITGNVLRRADREAPHVHWVICGGESGPKARPMHSEWACSLRDQCEAAGVPFLFKQWGEWLGEKQDGTHDHEPIELNATDAPVRVGKRAAGRLLGGRSHDDWPEVLHG